MDVIMPQMGESIAEGTITKWLKQPGDTVERDEPLFEISTDKVDAEIPAPADGTLLEIKVPEGETVEVNSVVAILGAAGETVSAAPAAEPAAAAAAAPAAAASEPAPAPAQAAPVAQSPAPATPPAPAATPATPAGGPPDAVEKPYDRYSVEELRKTRSSPVVRNIAAEHGIDVTSIQGTGASGRVTKSDILAVVESGAPGSAPAQTPAVPAPATAPPATMPAAAPGEGLVIPDLRIPPYGTGERVEVEPMGVMRKKIAEHMIYSQAVSAHVTSFFEIDLEEVAKDRRAHKSEFAERGAHLTYMAYICRAIVDGLQKFPYLNASVMGDQIVFKKDINLGIAVALEAGKGLIVPVIHNADGLNLFGMAKAINDLGTRARNKGLMPDDVQRGTFSITNPGVYGGLMGTPIINQPQVAILGIGVVEKRAVVVNDAIAIRHRCYFTLSYDHRLVDGAMAEMFMAHVKQFLEAGGIQ